MIEASDARVLAQQWLVIRSERLGSTHSGFDAYLLQAGHAIDSALQMNAKDIVVKFEKTEGKILLNLVPKTGIDLVASDMQSVALQLQVHRGVVVPKNIYQIIQAA